MSVIMILDPPDVMIRPDLEEYFMIDNVAFEVLYERGYQAADRVIHDMQDAVSWSNNLKRHFHQARIPEWIELHLNGVQDG